MTFVTFRTRRTLIIERGNVIIWCNLLIIINTIPKDHQLPSCQQDRARQVLQVDQRDHARQGIHAHREVHWNRVDQVVLEVQVHHLFRGYQAFRKHQEVPNIYNMVIYFNLISFKNVWIYLEAS